MHDTISIDETNCDVSQFYSFIKNNQNRAW